MVFLSLNLLARSRGPDEFWRKRKIFKLAAHFYSRRRNCYSITIKSVHKALLFSTLGRKLKKVDVKELWQIRTDSAAQEHGIDFKTLNEGLTRCKVLLNRKSLADLAVWEPYTFQSLTSIARAGVAQDPPSGVALPSFPQNVIIKGSLD
ncbi:hypothetical protein KM043_001531 [Ampulex compressa]|nr:hypothetical protein KM043_001531 [Ampulex compressa]